MVEARLLDAEGAQLNKRLLPCEPNVARDSALGSLNAPPILDPIGALIAMPAATNATLELTAWYSANDRSFGEPHARGTTPVSLTEGKANTAHVVMVVCEDGAVCGP